MKTIDYTPCDGNTPCNPLATTNHNRYAFAVKRQTEYLITLGERLNNKTWFVNGRNATFCLKKVLQCEKIINHYRNKKL